MSICRRHLGMLQKLRTGFPNLHFAAHKGRATCNQMMDSVLAASTWTSSTSSDLSASNTYLVVGLGNAQLPQTRHSIGMQVVDRLAQSLDVRWSHHRPVHGMVTRAIIRQEMNIVLLKPKVPMNINGRSVYNAVKQYSVEPSRVYLVHDELDQPVGVSRVREGGSANGHNGVRSVISSLKSQDMPRLLIGIDRPSNRNHVAQYVLGNFTDAEKQVLDTVVTEGLHKLLRHIERDMGNCINLVTMLARPGTEAT